MVGFEFISERELALRRERKEKIREAIKKGELAPTRRAIGKRKYKARLPDFKTMDTDMPAVKNIEASNEPLK